MYDIETAGNLFGLILIAIAWFMQLISSWKGDRTLRKRFVIFNNIGLCWLAIFNFSYGNSLLAMFYIFVFIIASLVLAKIGMNEDKKHAKLSKKKKK